MLTCTCVHYHSSKFTGNVIAARERSLGQGNVFTPVCHFVHRGRGREGVCGRHPPRQNPPRQTPPRQTPPPANTCPGRHPLEQTSPPGQTPPTDIPPGQTPSWQTPPPRQAPLLGQTLPPPTPRQQLKWAVCILLEYILLSVDPAFRE